MTPLHRRLAALEQATWDRRKRQILRAGFADVARQHRWTPDELEREVQAGLDDLNRMEPVLKVMCGRGATLGEVLAWMATGVEVDTDELRIEAERSGLINGSRWS